jgi:glutamate racemase
MPATGPQSPIGVFDSGVGGLSVLRHIRALLPGEDLLYLADSRHAPYGDRPPRWIRARSLELAEWLVGQGCKAIVVACNTATAAAAPSIRERLTIPVIAMEPALKPAAAVTRTGVVGVLATTGTLESDRFASLRDRFGAGVEVVAQPCPGLVEQIERGALDTPETRALVASFVAPLLARRADTIVLGCTHYPFVREAIAAAAGPGVALLDAGIAVARQVQARLAEAGLLSSAVGPGRDRLLTTGGPEAAAAAGRLWPGGPGAERVEIPGTGPIEVA